MFKLIKAIVFDIGGVIVGDLSHSLIPYLSKKYKKEYGELKAKWRLYAYPYRTGKMTENEFWKRFIVATEINEGVDDLKRYARKFFDRRVNGTLDITKKLKKNYKMAILSNHTKDWVSYIIKKYKLRTLFNPIVVSADIGYAKPDPHIYEALLKKLELKAEECLFVDNKEVNDVTAAHLGFNCILFKDAENLKHDLNKLGVEVD